MLLSLINVMLYICLALLIGYFLLVRMPENSRPTLKVPEIQLKLLILTIPILLLIPVVSVVFTLYNQFSLPVAEAVNTVFLEYSIGQAFLISLVLAIGLVVFLDKLKKSWMAFLIVSALIFLSSWSSHGAAVAGWFGFIGNSLHLLAVSVWIGTLSVVAWFSNDWNDPRRFFRWFSIVAAIAVVMIIGSGFMLMEAIVPEYVQAWLLSYGQLLVMKHLLFLPLLAFGFHHFLLGNSKVDFENKARLIKSFRIESLIALLVFTISAFMTEQTPPHEVAQTLQTETISPVMKLFIGEQANIGAIHLSVTPITVLLVAIAIILFIVATRSLLRSGKLATTSALFIISILTLYTNLMVSVEIGGYEQDETVYQTLEEAVSATYHANARIDLLLMEQDQNEIHVVYSVDQQDLVAEKIVEAEGGYKRLPAAMLTIGGTAIVDEKQKIRTFRIQSGNWHNENYRYTYVTFGMIQEPNNVARVQIHYEGGSYIAPLHATTFINVFSTNDNWADQHPIDFLAEDGRVIETYARNVMEEGVYCH
ncbi:copper resistance D family protein [Halalkalibacter kiskunsagensis]|uniref:Copper resistance D family protein n=1 Tax=Halalkalibacter kiskunsagensis TaxID=1548599 RepID=A0ABV6KEW4_9BACI